MRNRAAELERLQEQLTETRKRAKRKIRELDARADGSFPPPDAAGQLSGSAEPGR